MMQFNIEVYMKNIFVITIFLSFFALNAAAQNLDPTVEVSRQYEGKLAEFHKPSIQMAVPDSVTRFDLTFDYSVFDNPYKGSYEFKPYLLSMKPSASDNGESVFYLRAGAGYQLHPTFDMVLSPKFKNRHFNMDIYAQHRSFFGNYWTIAPKDLDLATTGYDRESKDESEQYQWKGYDMMSKAGMNLRGDWELFALDFGAGYYGLHQSDRGTVRNYNALDAEFGITSKPESQESMVFDLDVDYRHGQDVVLGSQLFENIGGFEFNVGPFTAGNYRVSVNAGSDVAVYNGAIAATAGEFHIVPSIVYNINRFYANIGARISKQISDKGESGMYQGPVGQIEQFIYPDVEFSYVLIPDAMKVYMEVGGGNRMDTYSSLVESNHFMTHLVSGNMLDFTVEKVNFTAGFDGRVTDKFSYNVRAGFANYANMRAYAMSIDPNPQVSVTYLSCKSKFAALDWALDVEGFRFDGSVSYNQYASKGTFENGGVNYAVLKPAAWTGDMGVEYSWRNRVVGGVDCEFSSAMTGGYGVPFGEESDLVLQRNVVIPGYADLGLYVEYSTARNIAFWMRAGNLLNMTIQRVPLYAEKGVHFTLGICMNL